MAKVTREKLRFRYLKLDLIDVSPSNVRKSSLEEGIDELAKSIGEIGVQQAVTVFKKGERYELIVGQRRYLACKKAGETEIPALITKGKDRTEAIIRSFSENIQRRDLDYRDKMQAALELLNRLGSIREVASHLGVSEPTVTRYLGYAAVPDEIKRMVDEGKLGATTALEIVQNIADPERSVEIAKRVKEIRRSEDRSFFIQVAREKPLPVGEVFKIAKRRASMKQIIIHVTERVYDAVVEAALRYEREKEDIAREAVEEWLVKKGLIK